MVLVTGASSGIGAAIATKFLNNGYSVTGIDKAPSERVFSDSRYTHIIADLVQQMPVVEDCDIVILCHGTEDEASAIKVNLESTIAAAERYTVENARLRSVCIVASMSATNACETPCYTASKGGIKLYAKNLANRLAERGVTVNTVSPGMVPTRMTEDIMNSPDKLRKVIDQSLLGKVCYSEEVADLVYYLTVVNKSITGQDIIIDNGETAKFNFIK